MAFVQRFLKEYTIPNTIDFWMFHWWFCNRKTTLLTKKLLRHILRHVIAPISQKTYCDMFHWLCLYDLAWYIVRTVISFKLIFMSVVHLSSFCPSNSVCLFICMLFLSVSNLLISYSDVTLNHDWFQLHHQEEVRLKGLHQGMVLRQLRSLNSRAMVS